MPCHTCCKCSVWPRGKCEGVYLLRVARGMAWRRAWQNEICFIEITITHKSVAREAALYLLQYSFLVSLHSRSQIGLQMTLLKKAKGGTDNTISLVPSLNPPLFDTISNETEKWNNKSSYSRTEPCKIFGFEKEKCAISRLDKLNEEEIAKIYKKPKTEAGAKWYVVAFAFLDAWHIWGPSSNYFCVTFLWQVGMRRCLLKYGHYDIWLLLTLSSHF